MKMRTASAIIEKLGGTSAVASALNRTPSTISSWKEVNYIPEWWHDRLVKFAKKRGLSISTIDFPTADDRVSRNRSDLAA